MRRRLCATLVALSLNLAVPAFAQDGDATTCPNPTPTAVAVTTVPIVVPSTTDDYFVLYVRPDTNAVATVDLPVSVTRGAAGTTTLSAPVRALPAERYRVKKYRVACPADVDGDGLDDLTELDDPTGNPVNPAKALHICDAAVAIPDRATFETLAHDFVYDVRTFTDPRRHLARLKTVKLILFNLNSAHPGVYFMNTNTHLHHANFLEVIGSDLGEVHYPQLIYEPDLVAPDGSAGVYRIELIQGRFDEVVRAYALLAASLPFLDNNLAWYIPNVRLPHVQRELPEFRKYFNLVFHEDIVRATPFLALNPGVGVGRLKALDADDRPHPRDIALYEALPNELPRVAGLISSVPQTPLSHVNLRAKQDGIPNAFIRDAADNAKITALLDRYVRYEVTDLYWTLTAATQADVEAHYAASRPAQPQTPQRDLSVTTITPLSHVGFTDWKAFGVKAANVAVLGTLGFPAGTVPTGFAIPFSFYDRFMRETALGQETLLGKGKWPVEQKLTLAADTKLAAAVAAMLAHPVFQTDFAVQDEMLDDLRDAIKDATAPQWIIDALTTMHATYPAGQPLRYRSSTNTEDLPGFNGAGLYDSYTQKPDETTEDGIDKSLKQVFASLWTFRAFSEREFHRIDHLKTAMGVLVHPNYTDEVVNGVAVSFDPTPHNTRHYYVNSQVGEDLVTNPEAHSVPEELLLLKTGGYLILATSNLKEPGELLMSDAQLSQLRRHLTAIHDHFQGLYKPASGKPFAMEVEFKITSANRLAIKQARPWVFATARAGTPPTMQRMRRAVPAYNPWSGPPTTNTPITMQRPTPCTGTGTGTGTGGGSGGGGGGGRQPRSTPDRHGDTPAEATSLNPPRYTTGRIQRRLTARLQSRADVDYFQVEIPHAGVLTATTTGGVDTTGRLYQAQDAGDPVLLLDDTNSGLARNFQLGMAVDPGLYYLAVSAGRSFGDYTLRVHYTPASFGSPAPASFQSGLGVLAGWVCDAETVTIELETAQGDLQTYEPAIGTARADTAAVCGADTTDTGFGLLYNWNLLGNGRHTVRAVINEVEFAERQITVTTLGQEYRRGLTATTAVPDFPAAGQTTALRWEEAGQNFVIARGDGGGAGAQLTPEQAWLGVPAPGSFQSGLGVISGWVCDAEAVTLEMTPETGAVQTYEAGYGTARADTVDQCGDTDNGFGLLFNWNLLGDGQHTVRAYADGEAFAYSVVTVTTLGEEFAQNLHQTHTIPDFPEAGQTTTVEWQEAQQNFVITAVE